MSEIVIRARKITDKEFERIAAEVFKGPKRTAELVGEGSDR